MLARTLAVIAGALLSPLAPHAAAQKFDPGSVYICPDHETSGMDCYLEAVVHLYTMCRQVKSIEIIEFGLPAAQEGVNGAKSESCVEKQKINIVRPYQAALREATPWSEAVNQLRDLQKYWLDSMIDLRARAGEARNDYEVRVFKVYDDLKPRIEAVRVALTTAADGGANVKPEPKAKPAKAKAAAAAAKAN